MRERGRRYTNPREGCRKAGSKAEVSTEGDALSACLATACRIQLRYTPSVRRRLYSRAWNYGSNTVRERYNVKPHGVAQTLVSPAIGAAMPQRRGARFGFGIYRRCADRSISRRGHSAHQKRLLLALCRWSLARTGVCCWLCVAATQVEAKCVNHILPNVQGTQPIIRHSY